MNYEMTPKERILTALRMEEPDRVPVFPGLDYLISAKYGRYPLNVEYRNYVDSGVEYREHHWRNMLEFTKRFKYDAWFYMGHLGGSPESPREDIRVTDIGDGKIIERWIDTPKGRLKSTSIQKVPGNIVGQEGFVKDINEDVDKVEYLLWTHGPWISHHYVKCTMRVGITV